MESSGLPIPIGGFEPLSAVLQELSSSNGSQGLRRASEPRAPDASLTSPDHGSPIHNRKNQKKVAIVGNLDSLPLYQTINILPRSFGVKFDYKPGSGNDHLKQYMFRQSNRPKDNNIQFWRDIVSEFFARSGKKRWCISSHKNVDSLLKVSWQCNVCNMRPSCGFEISVELLPRLHKMKYDTGMLHERLHIDAPNEYQGEHGLIFLHYAKAIEENEYERVCIVHYGQLRVVFFPDLKIRSWEFCTQNHKVYLNQMFITPQARQVAAAMQNNKRSTQDCSSITHEVEQRCTDDDFPSSAYQMVEAFGMSFVSQLGLMRRHTQCVQGLEVPYLMNDPIVDTHEYGLQPNKSIAKFPRLDSNASSRTHRLEAFATSGCSHRTFHRGFGNTTSPSQEPKTLTRITQCQSDANSGYSWQPCFSILANPNDSPSPSVRSIQEITTAALGGNIDIGGGVLRSSMQVLRI